MAVLGISEKSIVLQDIIGFLETVQIGLVICVDVGVMCVMGHKISISGCSMASSDDLAPGNDLSCILALCLMISWCRLCMYRYNTGLGVGSVRSALAMGIGLTSGIVPLVEHVATCGVGMSWPEWLEIRSVLAIVCVRRVDKFTASSVDGGARSLGAAAGLALCWHVSPGVASDRSRVKCERSLENSWVRLTLLIDVFALKPRSLFLLAFLSNFFFFSGSSFRIHLCIRLVGL